MFPRYAGGKLLDDTDGAGPIPPGRPCGAGPGVLRDHETTGPKWLLGPGRLEGREASRRRLPYDQVSRRKCSTGILEQSGMDTVGDARASRTAPGGTPRGYGSGILPHGPSVRFAGLLPLVLRCSGVQLATGGRLEGLPLPLHDADASQERADRTPRGIPVGLSNHAPGNQTAPLSAGDDPGSGLDEPPTRTSPVLPRLDVRGSVQSRDREISVTRERFGRPPDRASRGGRSRDEFSSSRSEGGTRRVGIPGGRRILAARKGAKVAEELPWPSDPAPPGTKQDLSSESAILGTWISGNCRSPWSTGIAWRSKHIPESEAPLPRGRCRGDRFASEW